MLRRAEASRIKEEFWTTFGRYMNPVPSAEGVPINWINYHTGVKGIHFRMDAGSRSATIAISIEHADKAIREMYFEHFATLRGLLESEMNEEWEWQKDTNSDRPASRIVKILPGPSVFNKDNWPEMISFFKPRIIALDAFWTDARYTFENISGG